MVTIDVGGSETPVAARTEVGDSGVRQNRSRFTAREIIAVVISCALCGSAVVGFGTSVAVSQVIYCVALPPLVIAVVLFALRRLAPSRVWRWGSLSPDQLMSVAATFALIGSVVRVWSVPAPDVWSVIIVIGAFLLCVVSVGAPWLPPFRAEFSRRPASQAHPVARRALLTSLSSFEFDLVPSGKWRSPTPRYRRSPTEVMSSDETIRTLAEADARLAVELAASRANTVVDDEIMGEVPMPAGHHVSSEAGTTGLLPEDAVSIEQPAVKPFWVLPPVPRQVISEESGEPLFMISPAAWALVVHNRGTELVIRSEDGRVGVVGDLDGFERA